MNGNGKNKRKRKKKKKQFPDTPEEFYGREVWV